MTFEWEDITDEVLEKVVLVQYYPNSTCCFIDSAGSLKAITEDGQEYIAGFENTSRNREVEILKLFLGELPKKVLTVGSSPVKRKIGAGRDFLMQHIYQKRLLRQNLSRLEKTAQGARLSDRNRGCEKSS